MFIFFIFFARAQILNSIDARRGPGGIFAGGIDHDDPAKTSIPGAPSTLARARTRHAHVYFS
jgi:hypothetical protein